MKRFFTVLFLSLAAVGAAELPESISAAKWITVSNPPAATAFFRCKINLSPPVKRASLLTFLEGRNLSGQCYVNGRKIQLRPSPKLRDFRGHVRGVEAEFARELRRGYDNNYDL